MFLLCTVMWLGIITQRKARRHSKKPNLEDQLIIQYIHKLLVPKKYYVKFEKIKNT